MADWQNRFNPTLPAGSDVRIAFAYNAYTVTENGGYDADALFILAKQLRDSFDWETHTWDHLGMDAMNYADVSKLPLLQPFDRLIYNTQALNELTRNFAGAEVLFDTDLNVNTPDRWSNKSMVNPAITGLFNPEALRAIWDFGIRFVVGDNSRAELIPANLYHGLYTTVEKNGFDGLYIIPRHATDIYYCASRPINIEEQYNDRYRTYWGRDFTFDEILTEESSFNGHFLLSLRHDPYMFHQANLRKFTNTHGVETSLITSWMEAILTWTAKFTTLPSTFNLLL